MKISDLKMIRSVKPLNQVINDREITGCYQSDLLSWVMGHASRGDCWITIMSHLNIAAVASLLDLSCIIVAESEIPDQKTIDRATENDIPIFSTDLTSFEMARTLVDNGFFP